MHLRLIQATETIYDLPHDRALPFASETIRSLTSYCSETLSSVGQSHLLHHSQDSMRMGSTYESSSSHGGRGYRPPPRHGGQSTPQFRPPRHHSSSSDYMTFTPDQTQSPPLIRQTYRRQRQRTTDPRHIPLSDIDEENDPGSSSGQYMD